MLSLSRLVAACLCAASIVNTLPHSAESQHFGPVTRAQRLQEGWVDEEAKYFHEPGHDDSLGHYDARFYSGVVTDEERTETLRHMIRAYLQFFQQRNLETWIAHGTLLGWWWNGRILPWDWDIDTQVAGDTLAHLAEHYNQTRHRHSIEGTRKQREYLLDINPMSSERVRGDGMNIIDARWIDVTNGLFIDITGLSETEPHTNPGVVSCKNQHHYRLGDLYPMRDTIFEGMPAKIPNAYDKLLVEEYEEKALTLTEYEGHHWDSAQQLWVKTTADHPHLVHVEEDLPFDIPPELADEGHYEFVKH